MVLYLAVSADKYELPTAVADSGYELERMLGLRRGSVACHISYAKYGRVKRQRYFKIVIDDEEEVK